MKIYILFCLFALLLLLQACPCELAQGDFDTVPVPGEIGYSPEGQVKVNPPGFTWPVHSSAVQYVLEVSKQPCMNIREITVSYTVADFGRTANVHVLNYSFETNIPYFWRYSVVSATGTVLKSKTRNFIVTQESVAIQKPDLNTLVWQDHPRMLTASDKIELAKDLSSPGAPAGGPLNKLWYDANKSSIRGLGLKSGYAWVKQDPTTLVCQNYYDNVIQEADCYKNGKWEPNSKCDGLGSQAYSIYNSALAYSLDPTGKILSKCPFTHATIVKERLLQLSNWSDGALNAIPIENHYANFYLIPVAYDLVYNLFTNAERAKIENHIKIKIRKIFDHLYNFRNYFANPYAWGHESEYLSQMCTGTILIYPASGADNEMKQWLNYCLTAAYSFYPDHITNGAANGPAYASGRTAMFIDFALAFWKSTGLEDLMKKPYLREMSEFLFYTAPWYSRIAPIGDNSELREFFNIQFALSGYYKNYGDAAWGDALKWYMDNRANAFATDGLSFTDWDVKYLGYINYPIKNLLLRNLETSAYIPESQKLTVLKDIGLISYHSKFNDLAFPGNTDIHFMFKASSKYAEHGRRDNNTFILDVGPLNFIIDSGYYETCQTAEKREQYCVPKWNKKNHHCSWTRHSRAHNTVTYYNAPGVFPDNYKFGQEFPNLGTIRYFESIKNLVETPTVVSFTGDASPYYENVNFERNVWIVKPNAFVLYDKVSSKDNQPRIFAINFHANKDAFQKDPVKNMYSVSQGGYKVTVEFLSADTIELTEQFDQNIITGLDGYGKPIIEAQPFLETCKVGSVTYNNTPLQHHLTVKKPSALANAEFITVIRVIEDVAKADTGASIGAKLSTDGKSIEINRNGVVRVIKIK